MRRETVLTEDNLIPERSDESDSGTMESSSSNSDVIIEEVVIEDVEEQEMENEGPRGNETTQ